MVTWVRFMQGQPGREESERVLKAAARGRRRRHLDALTSTMVARKAKTGSAGLGASDAYGCHGSRLSLYQNEREFGFNRGLFVIGNSTLQANGVVELGKTLRTCGRSARNARNAYHGLRTKAKTYDTLFGDDLWRRPSNMNQYSKQDW